jgi:hypothetical protein
MKKTYYALDDLGNSEPWFGSIPSVVTTLEDLRNVCDDDDDAIFDDFHEASIVEIAQQGIYDDDIREFGTLPTRAFVDGCIIDITDPSLSPEKIAAQYGMGKSVVIWIDGKTTKPADFFFQYDSETGKHTMVDFEDEE